MNTIGVIPSRYASSRFPGKPLIDINGKTMVQRVYEQCKKASRLKEVVVATDDQRIFDEVERFGGKAIMTSEDHQSGTDRCLEAVEAMDDEYEIVVNIQGDEPFISPDQINLLIGCFENKETKIATLIRLINNEKVLWDPNKAKVIVDSQDFAIYFSRQCIPYLRGKEKDSWLESFNYYKHIGMYAYRKDTLKELTELGQSKLEIAEGLEQLRWIENGYKIKTAITNEEAFSIDTPEDLKELLSKIN